MCRPMTLTVDSVTTIAGRIASELHPGLQVVGVVSTHGSSDRIELLLRLAGEDGESRMIVLNVARTEPQRLETELRAKLRDALMPQH